MMLLDNYGGQVNCFKAEKPKALMNKPENWVSVRAKVNDGEIDILYNTKNLSVNLFFERDGQWYRTPYTTKAGLCVLDYMLKGKTLYTADWMGARS